MCEKHPIFPFEIATYCKSVNYFFDSSYFLSTFSYDFSLVLPLIIEDAGKRHSVSLFVILTHLSFYTHGGLLAVLAFVVNLF